MAIEDRDYFIKQRDKLQERIDNGIRVTAKKDRHPDYNGWLAHEYGGCNATLILDEGIEL